MPIASQCWRVSRHGTVRPGRPQDGELDRPRGAQKRLGVTGVEYDPDRPNKTHCLLQHQTNGVPHTRVPFALGSQGRTANRMLRFLDTTSRNSRNSGIPKKFPEFPQKRIYSAIMQEFRNSQNSEGIPEFPEFPKFPKFRNSGISSIGRGQKSLADFFVFSFLKKETL